MSAYKSSGNDKGFGQKKSYGSKGGSYGQKKSYSGKSESSGQKSYGARNESYGARNESYGQKRAYGSNENRFGSRSENSSGSRSENRFGSRSENSFGNSAVNRYESKPASPQDSRSENRPLSKFNSKPYDKPYEKPYNKSQGKSFGKPFDKPKKKYDDRPPKRTGMDTRTMKEIKDRLSSPSFDAEGPAVAEDRIEGRNPVFEALRAGRPIDKIFVSKGDREGSIKQIVGYAREKKIVVQEVEKAKLDAMSTTRAHQGVIAFAAAKEYVEIEDILEIAKKKGEKPFIIIVDEVTDPHNLGSIMRTADAVGAHGVIIPKRRAVGLSAIVAKASAGAMEYVAVAKVTNLSQAVETLKKSGVWVIGTDQMGRQPFYEVDFKTPVAVVIGSEGEGIAKALKDNCDMVVKIPMKGNVTSLNASVAGSIVMYEVMRQRA